MAEITRLFEKYYNKTANADEVTALMHLIASDGYDQEVLQLVQPPRELPDREQPFFTASESLLQLQHIRKQAGIGAPVKRSDSFLKTSWFRYAAILVLLAGAVTFFYVGYQPQKETVLKTTIEKPAIPPGGNKAILTLADGSTIILDSAADGSLTVQGNTKILKLDAGSVAYRAGDAGGAVMYNTISTPRGGQYQIGLPDGSMVWLNAASSIRFPVTFGTERTVTITGEVYMEIAPDARKPFAVMVDDMEVQVLGTSFNINAYRDEPAIKTTLLEGAVRIAHTVLKPGQAFIDGKVVITDLQQDVAWKNGVFNFNKLSLQQAMRQIANWYNVEVVYEKGVPAITFGGKMERALNLSELLGLLKGMGVHFRLDEEGRKLFVSP